MILSSGITLPISQTAVTDLVAALAAKADLSSGVVPTAQLGSGTANSSSFLRGDRSWQAVTVPTAADSAVSVGMSRSVGTATTWKRSDAIDPIDPAIAPTWTAKHIWRLTTTQQEIQYDASNKWTDTIGSTGARTMAGVGAGGSLTITPTSGQNTTISSTLTTTGNITIANASAPTLHLSGVNSRVSFNSTGATDDLGTFAVAGSAGAFCNFAATGDMIFRANTTGKNIILSARNSGGAILFGTGSSDAERGRVSSAGNLLWGTTTDDGANKLQVNGTVAATAVKITTAGAAPGTTIGAAIINYYGTSATNFLGTPAAWIPITDSGGTVRQIPCY